MSEEGEEKKAYNNAPHFYDIDNEAETFGVHRAEPREVKGPEAVAEDKLAEMTPRQRKMYELSQRLV